MLPDTLIKSAAHIAQSLGIKLFGSRQVSFRHGLHALRVGDHFHDFACQRLVIVGRYKVFGDEQSGNPPYVRADAWTAAGHSFNQCARKSLSTGWHYKQIYGVKEITNRFAKAELVQETHISLKG